MSKKNNSTESPNIHDKQQLQCQDLQLFPHPKIIHNTITMIEDKLEEYL